MRRSALVILGTALWLALPSAPVRTWGLEGHHIVARIAWSQMTAAAKHAAQDLLGPDDFAASSTWADDVAKERPETYNWHFVNIPYDQYAYDATRDCRPSPRGDCVVAELERARHALSDLSAPKVQRQEALKFLIHFAGDIHQPLHAINNRDRGGNDVHVVLAGHPLPPDMTLTLHGAWDHAILEARGLDEAAYAGLLVRDINAYPLSALPIDFAAWASDAHQRAVEYVYTYPGFSPSGPTTAIVELSAEYQKKAQIAIDHQLELAGVRLAALLNQALGR